MDGAVVVQTLCTMIICYTCMMMGVIFTLPSSTLKLFGSANTTLDRPMDEVELSLLGSLSSIGGLITTPIVGFILDRLGRKYSSISISLIYVVSWMLLAVCNKVEVVLVSVFLSGIGGCIFMVIPIYITEICQENIRGMMTCGLNIFYYFGMLISYLMGGFLDYHTMMYTGLTMSVVGVLLLGILRESPLYFMIRGREKEAAQSIAFYRNVKVNSKEVLQEMDALRQSLNPPLDETPEEEKQLNFLKLQPQKLSTWQFFKKSRSSQRAFVVTLILFTASFFQGLLVILVYAEPLFAEAVPELSPTVCSSALALVSIAAGFVAAYVIEAAGRKPAMIYSSLGAGVCCILLGTQIHLQWGPPVLSSILIYIFCLVYTVGAGTVPFIVMVESFLPEVKSVLTTILMEYVWLVNFVILFVFNPLVTAIGLGPIFYIFAGFCFATAAYCFFFQPETKGLTVDAIQLLYWKKK